MIGVESISRIVFTREQIRSRHQRDRSEWDYGEQQAFFDFVKEQGVLVGNNRILFLSTVHTDEDIDTIIEALFNAFQLFASKGIL
jgi:glutamate-1-semialdehyde aminotransferase